MEETLFAYTMSQTGEGWSWRLWDEIGDVVAAGAAPDQASAHRGLMQAFESARGRAGSGGAPAGARRSKQAVNSSKPRHHLGAAGRG